MKKRKNTAIFILTAAMILICAMLPMIVGRIQDSLESSNIAYEEIKSVQFSKEISAVEKLFLLGFGDVAEASVEKARIDVKNIRKIIDNALLPYVEVGMIQNELSDFSIELCEPVLYYDSDGSDMSCLFWEIEMTGSTHQSIHLCIDDQTEKILVISYECKEEIYDEYAQMDFLEWFYNTYQNDLDLPNEELGGNASEEMNAEGNNAMKTYYLEDAKYGWLGIGFFVSANGFYNSGI